MLLSLIEHHCSGRATSGANQHQAWSDQAAAPALRGRETETTDA
jgi:hypothetical protein